MYLEHFELNEFPFAITPNTNFFCGLPTYNEALDLINISLDNEEGFIKIIGEVGVGKTLLCRKLLNELDSNKYITAYIANPNLDHATLYEVILKELDVKFPLKARQHELLNILNAKLLDARKNNKKVVVIIDEAQALADKVLEALRLLSNLETETSKLLHIVLFGQPELDRRLNKTKLRQLKQRIAFSYYLKPLNWSEIDDYLYFRLRTSGYKYGKLFSPLACKLLFKASSGIPLLVNILSHKALIAAYGYNKKKVSTKAMLLAIKDTDSSLTTFRKRLINYSLLIILTIVIGIEIYFIFRMTS